MGEQKVFRAVKSPNGLVVVGYTTERGDKDVFVAEIDTNGNLIFATVYGDSGVDEVGRAIEDVGDGYVVVGWRGSVGSRDAYVLKMDYVGNVLWDTTYDAYGEMGDNGLYGAVYDTLRGLVWGVGFMRWSWDTAYTGWLLGIDPASGDSVRATVVGHDSTLHELLYDVDVLSDGRLVAVGKSIPLGFSWPSLEYLFATGFILDTSLSTVDTFYVFLLYACSVYIENGVSLNVKALADTFLNFLAIGSAFYTFTGFPMDDFRSYPMGILFTFQDYVPLSMGYSSDSFYHHIPLSTLWEGDTLALITGFMGDLDVERGGGSTHYILDPSDTTLPYPPLIDTSGERSAKILVGTYRVEDFGGSFRTVGVYDFPRTDVGAGARYVQGAGDSTDILIVGYSNSFSSSPEDYDLIALRVRPERLGVFERVVSLDGGEGMVEVYDVSGRLVGRGERLEDIRLRRGVFFVKEGRKVRRMLIGR